MQLLCNLYDWYSIILNMVTICLQCGDEGWNNAFVYCVKCLNEAVHRYCLDVIPQTYDEFVPWVCDVCQEKSQKVTSSNSVAEVQGQMLSEQIEVDSTIILKKKRISHLAEWAENGHCENGGGLQSPHKELDSGKDEKTRGKRCSEQSGVDSTLTLKRKKISHSTETVENGPWNKREGLRSANKKVESSKDATIQRKRRSEEIGVGSTIKPNKRISPLTERVENGPCKNREGLRSANRKVESSKDATIQRKRRSEEIGVGSTIKPNKKRISHLTERVENGHCKNGAELQSSHKELDSREDPKTQRMECSKQIEDDSTITLNKKSISHLTERAENGHCKNRVELQPPHKELDSSEYPTQEKACSEQIEDDSTTTLNKKRISQLTERVENGHCKSGVELQSPHKELDSSEDPKTQEKACSEKIEVDSTITVDKKRISRLTERVDNLAGLQSSHKEPDSSNGAELACLYRPSRAGTKSIDDCSHMVLMNNEPRSPTNSSEPQKTNKVEGVANSLPRKAKLRKLNELSLLVTTNQSRSSDPAEFDEEDVSCSVDFFAEQILENVSALKPHKQGQDNNDERETDPTEELAKASCDKNNAISQPPMKAQPIVAASENLQRAKPLMDPIWRGNFNILNQDGTVEGLAAHLSCKACRMVYNEASLLPTSLHLEILPKDVVWPKSFEKSEPTDDNIAMYILPTNPRKASPFDVLVSKMTQQELAMKAVTKNAELLIFTSTELPLSYWRFREKWYLWGVFRGKTSLLSSHPAGDPVVPE